MAKDAALGMNWCDLTFQCNSNYCGTKLNTLSLLDGTLQVALE
jgi:hypothetical protein